LREQFLNGTLAHKKSFSATNVLSKSNYVEKNQKIDKRTCKIKDIKIRDKTNTDQQLIIDKYKDIRPRDRHVNVPLKCQDHEGVLS